MGSTSPTSRQVEAGSTRRGGLALTRTGGGVACVSYTEAPEGPLRIDLDQGKSARVSLRQPRLPVSLNCTACLPSNVSAIDIRCQSSRIRTSLPRSGVSIFQ